MDIEKYRKTLRLACDAGISYGEIQSINRAIADLESAIWCRQPTADHDVRVHRLFAQYGVYFEAV